MITVHHLNHSRSQRVLWLLEELELPYEIKYYERDPVTRLAPPSLKAVHPLGKSPVVVDDGVTIAETGAIVDYLVEASGGKLRPEAGTPDRLRWTYWSHFAEGSLMPQLLLDLMLTIIPGRAPEALQEAAKSAAEAARLTYAAPNLKTMFDFVEAELATRPWFAGEEFSSADVMMSFPLEAGGARAGAFEGRRKIEAFVERIHARPAYRRALVRGGPYAYAA
ncbi:glutathione S-transferase [Roseiarcus fermentans]|uniref:glutathione transferase n=1 Tax=Roseiarcus fermentans TaxID=1473586 RepID=A0A366F1S1_9HYPH|nr:glutathione S-transferase [Roseiarcus fermentans]RBP08547.1 glutathione S-transferase [Roseiarcus fermentans]